MDGSKLRLLGNRQTEAGHVANMLQRVYGATWHEFSLDPQSRDTSAQAQNLLIRAFVVFHIVPAQNEATLVANLLTTLYGNGWRQRANRFIETGRFD